MLILIFFSPLLLPPPPPQPFSINCLFKKIIGDTICPRQEIQCLPYTEFLPSRQEKYRVEIAKVFLSGLLGLPCEWPVSTWSWMNGGSDALGRLQPGQRGAGRGDTAGKNSFNKRLNFYFSSTRPSGPSCSSSRDVRVLLLSLCLFVCPLFMQFFLCGRTGAERASSMDWCDLHLE